MQLRIRYIGRWRIYEKLRRFLFEDIVRIDYAEREDDIEDTLTFILVDKAFEKQFRNISKRRSYKIIDELDDEELLAFLTKLISELMQCEEVVIGVDPGPEYSGVAVTHCQIPTLHALLPTFRVLKLVKILIHTYNMYNVSVCIGVSTRSKHVDYMSALRMLISSLSREVPTYLVSEESTKYRRSITYSRRQCKTISSHELDAVIYALSIDHGVRAQI